MRVNKRSFFGFIPSLLVLSLVLSSASFAEEAKGKKPFKRALVIAGGSLRTAAFLGTLAGLKEQGWVPDIILATCGASMAGGIASLSEDPKDWEAYVKSKEFYEYLNQIKPNPAFDTGAEITGPLLAKIKDRSLVKVFGTKYRKIPDVFSVRLVDLPLTSGLSLSQEKFQPGSVNRLIALSGRVQFTQKEVGKAVANRKLIDPVFFTDSETAKHLAGVTLAGPKNFPTSYISDKAHVISDVALFDGIRASMSEPSLVELKTIGEGEAASSFIAGSLDAYPTELASELAEEVISVAAGVQGPLEEVVFQDTYGFDINERLKQTQSVPIKHWIDYTDIGVLDDEAGFGPKLNANPEKLKSLDLSGLKMEVFMPEYDDYLERIDKWWELGRARAIEALKTKEGSREHLRDDCIKKTPITFRQIEKGVVDPLHVWQAPVVATLDGFQVLAPQTSDGQLVGASWDVQLPYLGTGLLASIILETVRRNYLDAGKPASPNLSRSSQAYGWAKFATSHYLGIRPAVTATRLAWRAGTFPVKACYGAYKKLTRRESPTT